jgi:hypothetical protein
VIRKRQRGRILAHRSLHSLCCLDSYEGIGLDDNRMAQGLVSAVRARELPILTVRFFAESTLPHEVGRCHGGGGGGLFDSPKPVAFELELHSIAVIVDSRH